MLHSLSSLRVTSHKGLPANYFTYLYKVLHTVLLLNGYHHIRVKFAVMYVSA